MPPQSKAIAWGTQNFYAAHLWRFLLPPGALKRGVFPCGVSGSFTEDVFCWWLTTKRRKQSGRWCAHCGAPYNYNKACRIVSLQLRDRSRESSHTEA